VRNRNSYNKSDDRKKNFNGFIYEKNEECVHMQSLLMTDGSVRVKKKVVLLCRKGKERSEE
jgi:hypothetical protein